MVARPHRTRSSCPGRRFPALPALLAVLLASGLAGCGDDGGEPPAGSTSSPTARVDLPDRIDLTPPTDAITVLDVVEDMSEEVANRFLGLADQVRRRHFTEGRDWLTDDFAGHAPGATPVAETRSLPLGVTKTVHAIDAPDIVDADGWLASLATLTEPFGIVEDVRFKVKGAAFAPGAVPRGHVTFRVSIQGRDPDGGMRSIVMWSLADVLPVRGEWAMRRFQITSLDVTTRAAPLFTDVAVPAGLGHKTGMFGRDIPPVFDWNGAAVSDVDGDGLWDLYVPSTERAFLYRNAGDGTFEDVTEAWGLSSEHGGTGSVFFDYDGDGDADLVTGHVGWAGPGDATDGQPTRLYRNDGDRFTDVSEAAGLDGWHATFSVVAGDFDGNGHTDVYVCSYNRMQVEYPDSWFQAANGTPNALYMNDGDGTFTEEAAERGAADSRWTFAAAAADFDEDGDLDMYLANDFGDNALLVNDGAGHFEDRAAVMGVTDTGNGMAATWGDLDDDGHLDLYVSNMSSTAGNRILRRFVSPDDEGTGGILLKLAAGNTVFKYTPDTGFERLSPDDGGTGAAWAWSCNVLDFDLDGHQDVMVANGFISGESLADT